MSAKQTYYPFESIIRRQLRKLRESAVSPQLEGYLDGEGDTQPVQGDEFGPYYRPIGLASDDGQAGAIEVQNGEPQLLLTDLFGKLWMAPGVNLTDEETLVLDVAMAAAGAFTATPIIDVEKWRRLNLSVRYTGGAVGGFPQIIPMRAKTATIPLTTDDDWYGFGLTDGSVTAAPLTGAMPAQVDVTITPAWGTVVERGLVIQTEACTGAAQNVRLDVELNVESVKWVFLLYAERGFAATPGTLGLRYNMSTG